MINQPLYAVGRHFQCYSSNEQQQQQKPQQLTTEVVKYTIFRIVKRVNVAHLNLHMTQMVVFAYVDVDVVVLFTSSNMVSCVLDHRVILIQLNL